MQWVVVTSDDLRTGKASAVVDAFQSAALGTGQADPTDDAIANASQRIRAEIQSSGKYLMSATALAIPPSLKSLAVRLILWDLQSRLNTIGGTFEPNEQEKTDHRDDLRYLERISMGKVPIEKPDDPLTPPETQSGGSIEVGDQQKSTTQPGRVSTREQLAGL